MKQNMIPCKMWRKPYINTTFNWLLFLLIKFIQGEGEKMKKITAIVLLGTAALILSACGGSSSGSSSDSVPVDPMTEREVIIISYGFTPGTCVTVGDKLIAHGNGENVLTKEIANSDVSCATYGREKDGSIGCSEQNYEISDIACVVAYDLIGGSNQYIVPLTI